MTFTELLAAYTQAIDTMKAAIQDSPLQPVIFALNVEALRPHSAPRLHVVLDGHLPVAALLADPLFRDRLAPLLTPADVERAQLHFTADPATLATTVEVLGTDLGTASLLEPLTLDYVRARRFLAEQLAGLHPKAQHTEAEIAASSPLNRQWRPPTFVGDAIVHQRR
ncbi:hypothetical protein GO986_12090 [Deinococcus sp. HMF7620]|uniref:Uncharacterized protein n=1 Tax=Deinococcus arboris TaxID=2682977 RepID=A0A7C9M6X8_9DEIO|nr:MULTISPECIES: hypothetical protein [Deinococcus]MBZ9752143.1 hypothetical protein [Deinococcus betulae]MVN87505.1 hypothetical protein [Deinococcus arboris]